MASFVFGSGKRAQALALATLRYNPEAVAESDVDEVGRECVRKVSGPCLTMTRAMVSKAYFGGEPRYEESVDMQLSFFALKAEGKLLKNTAERAIVADDDGEKPMALRMKAHHQAGIARFSAKLGMSRNDFVLEAIERYVGYLADVESMEDDE